MKDVKNERYIEVVARLPETLFIPFKQACWKQRKSEEKLLIEILEEVLAKGLK